MRDFWIWWHSYAKCLNPRALCWWRAGRRSCYQCRTTEAHQTCTLTAQHFRLSSETSSTACAGDNTTAKGRGKCCADPTERHRSASPDCGLRWRKVVWSFCFLPKAADKLSWFHNFKQLLYCSSYSSSSALPLKPQTHAVRVTWVAPVSHCLPDVVSFHISPGVLLTWGGFALPAVRSLQIQRARRRHPRDKTASATGEGLIRPMGYPAMQNHTNPLCSFLQQPAM